MRPESHSEGPTRARARERARARFAKKQRTQELFLNPLLISHFKILGIGHGHGHG